MKKKNILFISVALTSILMLFTTFYIKNKTNLDINIEGVNINKNQYVNVMKSKEYDVTQYFIEKYGANVTNEFWQQDFNGEIPYKILADKTVEELLRINSIYKIAKEKGYVDSIEYEDFLERLEDENNIREKKIKEGYAVYGLAKFTEDIYLEYETDKIQKAYCNDLNNEGMDISLEEATKYYEENKDLLFKKDDDFKLSYVKVYYTYLELPEKEVQNIKDQMLEVSKKIDDNNSLDSLVSNNEVLKDYYFNETILSSEVSSKAKAIGDVLDIAFNLERGEVTKVLDQNGCLYLIQCNDKVDYDYYTYEEVEDNIKKVLREEKYNQIVENNTKNLDISNNVHNTYEFTNNILKER